MNTKVLLMLIWSTVVVDLATADDVNVPSKQSSNESRHSDARTKLDQNQSQVTLRAPWKLLWLDSERIVTKVRVKLYSYKSIPAGAHNRTIDIAVESDERVVLDNFTVGLTHGLIYTPKEIIGREGIGSLPTGELEVITNKDSFKVTFDTRFVLGENYWKADNWFVCWTLAKAVDDLLWDKARRHLEDDEFERLSGESWLKAERENYKKRVEAAKSDKNGTRAK